MHWKRYHTNLAKRLQIPHDLLIQFSHQQLILLVYCKQKKVETKWDDWLQKLVLDKTLGNQTDLSFSSMTVSDETSQIWLSTEDICIQVQSFRTRK